MFERKAGQYDTIPLECAGDMYERKAGQYDKILISIQSGNICVCPLSQK